MFIKRDQDYMNSLRDAYDKETRGPAYTAIFEKKVYGCAGIALMWSGMGIVWAAFSKELLEQFPIWTTRTVRQVLRDAIRTFKLHRLEMVAIADNDINNKWAELLGFTPENNAIARAYTSDKLDMRRYEFIIGGE